MIFNLEVCVQRKIIERVGLLSLLNSIWKNTRDHDKKENEERNTVDYWDIINNKEECTKKPRIKISKEIMNIPGR